jgi:lipid-A-disaccharide synthase-like uncharacterized protein
MEHGIGYFLGYLIARSRDYIAGMPNVDLAWLLFGLAGQSLFMMRFIVQWLHSERHKQSLIPVSFWYFSLFGGLIVLAYGFHRSDPVIILGQLPGTIVYARNLMLIRQASKDAEQDDR